MSADYTMDLESVGATVKQTRNDGIILIDYQGPIDRLLRATTYSYTVAGKHGSLTAVKPAV